MATQNEFFILIAPVETHADENEAIPFEEMSPDSPLTAASISSVSVSGNNIIVNTGAAHGFKLGTALKNSGITGMTGDPNVFCEVSYVASTTQFYFLHSGLSGSGTGGTATPIQTAHPPSGLLGLIITERDMLSANESVVLPIPGTGRFSVAY